jgi:hypothetical protein
MGNFLPSFVDKSASEIERNTIMKPKRKASDPDSLKREALGNLRAAFRNLAELRRLTGVEEFVNFGRLFSEAALPEASRTMKPKELADLRAVLRRGNLIIERVLRSCTREQLARLATTINEVEYLTVLTEFAICVGEANGDFKHVS